MKPQLSSHFESRMPSAIRLTQIEFLKRTDGVVAVNTAIGNVSLPMHPALIKRMSALSHSDSPFRQGAVKYSTTVGEGETTRAFLHLIASSGFSTEGLYAQITEGGSQAMELVILGVCGPAGVEKHPLLVMDPIYSNYIAFAERTGRSTVAITRELKENGKFTLPELSEIEKVIKKTSPGALLVIPYDNPTGQFFPQSALNALGALCVKHNLWMVSDEAYRELHYTKDKASSIWGVTEKEVPGISGRRISIESASKVWNACGLRIGAIVTDNAEFHRQSVAENTANLCPNAIGQYIFGALSHESKEQLQGWYKQQRTYYEEIATTLAAGLKNELPGIVVSAPDAALYTVVDVRNICKADFDAQDFALFCARKGEVVIEGVKKTLLVAPMADFYSSDPAKGKTQMRIAYVEPPHIMAQAPKLLAQLLRDYCL